MVLKVWIIAFFIAMIQVCEARTKGEIDFDVYFGPHSPSFYLDESNHIIFEDQKTEQIYIEQMIQPEIFEIENFLEGEFAQAVSCPSGDFEQMRGYIEYLVRLQVMSYLFEAVRKYQFIAQQLGQEEACSPDWKSIFKKCKAESTEMKDFLKNSQHILNHLEPIHVPIEKSKKSFVEKWLKDFPSKDNSLVGKRFQHHCQRNSCPNSFDVKKVEVVLAGICHEDMSLVKAICEERDRLRGVSYIPEIYPLILRSNALRVFERDELAAGCLRRYINAGKVSESKNFQLIPIFQILYSQYVRLGAEYERGRLFSLGSLQEFQIKGLKDIFASFDRKQKKAEQERKKVELKPLIFRKIELPKFKPKVTKKEKKKKKVVSKKPQIVYSQSSFLEASELRKEFELSQAEVNMSKFRYDYIFSLETARKFEPTVEKMSQIKSLRRMKREDKLGTKFAPLPLRFLKFMIDREMHQRLFNVVHVVGDKFFVRNDIDKGNYPLELIELKNDITTNFKWQIIIHGTI